MTLNINVETKNVIKIFALAVGFTVSVLAIFKMYDALMLVLIAFFIALALNPAVDFISRYMPGKRRGPAIVIVLIGVIALLGFLLASIIPPILSETGKFIKTLPDTLNHSFYRNERTQDIIERYNLQGPIDATVENIRQRATNYGDDVVTSARQVGNSLINTLTVLVTAILMLTGGPSLLRRFSQKMYRNTALKKRHEIIASRMYQAVTGYVVGQVSVALVASLFAFGALVLLKVPYPLSLAGIVFIFGLIPLIGNTLAAILVVLAALILSNTTSALILLGFFILYQQIENVTLQPIVQGKTTNLPPLVIFVSVILGVGLIGPIGGLFAIQAAGCAKVLLNDYLEHRDDLKSEDSPAKLVTKIKHKLTGVKA